jgi:hypothetical protein
MNSVRQVIEAESSRRAFQAIQRSSILGWAERVFPVRVDEELRIRKFEAHPFLNSSGQFRINLQPGDVYPVDKLWVICSLWKPGAKASYGWEAFGPVTVREREARVMRVVDEMIAGIEKEAATEPVMADMRAKEVLLSKIKDWIDEAELRVRR